MTDTPRITTVGLGGVLITFADQMSEAANRAAIALAAEIDAQGWPDIGEVSSSLVSTFVQADLASVPLAPLQDRIREVLLSRDWLSAPLPEGRMRWHIPTLYGTHRAPQLAEAAALAGVEVETAISELSSATVRVLTMGFAPGQPYLGALPPHWNIPRQTDITAAVPPGSLVCAVSQLIIFTSRAPTGWRHVGQTAFHNFRPTQDPPFAFRAGDELCFPAISEGELNRIERTAAPDGGATREAI